MLCLSCKARWDKPTTEVLHLPHPPKKKKVNLEDKLHQGEIFMFGPDAM